MIISYKFKVPHSIYNYTIDYLHSLKWWCKHNLKDYRLFCDTDGGKVYWNQRDLEIEIIFNNIEDKTLFLLVKDTIVKSVFDDTVDP